MDSHVEDEFTVGVGVGAGVLFAGIDDANTLNGFAEGVDDGAGDGFCLGLGCPYSY